MPFDVLPHHNIRYPNVQMPNIPWGEYARLASEGAWKKYAALMQGMDTILNALDPVKQAERRLSIMNAQYETQFGMPARIAAARYQMETGIPLQEAQAKYQLQYGIPAEQAYSQAQMDWYKAHPGEPFPRSYSDINARDKAEASRQRAEGFNETKRQIQEYYKNRGQPQTTTIPGLQPFHANELTLAPGQPTATAPSVSLGPNLPPAPTATPIPSATPAQVQAAATPVPAISPAVPAPTSTPTVDSAAVGASPSPVPISTPPPTDIAVVPNPQTVTITGGRLTDDQGNLLPPSEQGVP